MGPHPGLRQGQDFSVYSPKSSYFLPFLLWQPFLKNSPSTRVPAPAETLLLGWETAGLGPSRDILSWPQSWGCGHQLPPPPAWSHPARGAGLRATSEGRYGCMDTQAYGCTDIWTQGYRHMGTQMDGHKDCWTHRHMGSQVHKCMDAWTHECTDTWVHRHMDTLIGGHMDAWIQRCRDVWVHGYTDAEMYGYMDAWTQRCRDRWMHGCTDARTHRQMVTRIHRCTSIWVHRPMDAWTQGQTDTRTQGHTDLQQTHSHTKACSSGYTATHPKAHAGQRSSGSKALPPWHRASPCPALPTAPMQDWAWPPRQAHPDLPGHPLLLSAPNGQLCPELLWGQQGPELTALRAAPFCGETEAGY